MKKLRRTMMFVPASNASMIRDANLYGADSIMFDLEDSVSPQEKDSSRFLLFESLRKLDFSPTETIVRINALDAGGKDDIHAMVRAGIDVIRLPKTESKKDILDVEAIIQDAEIDCGKEVGCTKIFGAIEGPLGVLNSLEIAFSSDRLIGLALGAEDYVTAMKTRRYPEKASEELFFARSMILHSARAAGIDAIDTVFSDVEDMETLVKETLFIKQLGFDGKSVINPRQIPIINSIFKPGKEEIENAKDVMRAIKEAEERGSGVISLKGKMIDKPIVERAERTIQLAKANGINVEGDM